MAYSFKNLLNTLRGERIDQPDLRHAVETSQLHNQAQLASAIMTGGIAATGGQNTQTYILGGFVTTVNVLDLTVTGGQALLATRIDGQVVTGVVYTKDPATVSKTISLSNLPDGTYGVYVRLDLVEDAYTNRAFWNADAVTPVEYARIIPTRLVESWSIAVELTSPGAEWTQVSQVVKAAGALTPSDRRVLFYEGNPTASPAYSPNADWGGGNDRNSGRGVYGLANLRTFVRAIQRQIQDIIFGTSVPGGSGWYSAVTLGLADMLALDGSRDMAGDLTASPTNTYDIGVTGSIFRDLILGRNANIGGTLEVVGNAQFDADVAVGDDLTIADTLTVSGASTMNALTTINAELFVDDGIQNDGYQRLSSVLSGGTLAAEVDDYAPANFDTAYTLRLTAAGGGSNFNGLAGGAGGREIQILNIGTDTITFVSGAASSLAGNRFRLPAAAIVIDQWEMIRFWYDSAESRWIMSGRSGSGGNL